jgi:predicted small metal-binding protein
MGTSFENVNGATMGMKLGWKIQTNNLDEILDEMWTKKLYY